MDYLTIARILFIAFWINELFVLSKSTPEERANLFMPRWMPVMLVLMFLPLFWALDLPPWLGLLALVIQAVGLVMEIAGEIQLSRARSFSIAPRTPSEPQTDGLYRFLENPIYVAILIQQLGWSLWNPLTLISLILQYVIFRNMVSAERAQLASVSFVHRKLDSALWN